MSKMTATCNHCDWSLTTDSVDELVEATNAHQQSHESTEAAS